MSNQISHPDHEGAEDAALAHAGEPSKPSEAHELTADEGTPTPEELDARNEHFSGPRKPMGPTSGQVPETIPVELPEGP
ncbi:MAG: hypothetical protein ABR615_00950 [Pseudonocardiaceae bacterium]